MHDKGDPYPGLDMVKGTIGNVKELGITESHKLKTQVRMVLMVLAVLAAPVLLLVVVLVVLLLLLVLTPLLQVLISASEAAEQILRVDSIIATAPRQRQQGQ